MERIASFCVDHEKLQKGIYISRIDGDIVTYDIRMKKPNAEPVMDNAPIHTIEHLFATYARNSAEKEHVIYFGPMGCRTGFYFLCRDLPHERALTLMKNAFLFIAQYEGEIPGTTAKECGNYKDHDLAGAKMLAATFYPVIQNWTADNLSY